MHTCLLVAGEGKIDDLLAPFAENDGKGTNENVKFDWYEVGGRFGPMLCLKQPRQLRKFFGLMSAGTTTKVVSAKKSEIVQEVLLADPPADLLFRGKWSKSTPFAEGEKFEEWRKEFARLFSEIPDDTTLTVIDFHF